MHVVMCSRLSFLLPCSTRSPHNSISSVLNDVKLFNYLDSRRAFTVATASHFRRVAQQPRPELDDLENSRHFTDHALVFYWRRS